MNDKTVAGASIAAPKQAPMREYFMPGTLTFMKPELIETSPLQYPLMVNIEPTNHCNLKCYYCPREAMERELGHMSWEMYTGIIDDSVQYGGIQVINYHKDGESLLHPRICDMIRYAKEVGKVPITHFNTNALKMPDKQIRELIESGLDDLTFSIDAVKPETFKAMKGVDGLARVEANTRRFAEIRREMKRTKPFLRAKIIDCKESHDEVQPFLEKWSQELDEAYAQPINSFGGWLDIAPKGADHPCQSLWYTLAVNWDGSVNLCSDDFGGHEPVGHLKDQTLRQIWVGERMNTFREMMMENRRKEMPICQNCNRWEEGANLKSWLERRGTPRIESRA